MVWDLRLKIKTNEPNSYIDNDNYEKQQNCLMTLKLNY